MEVIAIVAFALGVIIAGAIAFIKYYKLEKADKMASKIVLILQIALTKYKKEITAYDKENGTNYYNDLKDLLAEVNKMVADENITPIEFALNVIEMYERITAILKDTNVFDKIEVETE